MKPSKPRQFNKRRFQLEPEKILIIKKVVLGLFLLALVAGIITGIWYGTRVQILTISDIKVTDGETIRASLIKSKAEEALVGDYIHLVPRRFAWFYPEAEILQRVQEIERIKDVSVRRVSGTEIDITFAEYFPDALWCKEGNEGCYFVDKGGFAFGKAPSLLGGSLVRFYKLGEEPKLKTNLMEEADYTNTKELAKLLAQSGWFVTKIEVDAVRDVFYSLAGGGELRASLQSDPTETFSYFESLINSKEFSHLKPGNFQYIDLRFGAKLYVNEEKKLEEGDNEEGADETGQDEVGLEAEIVETVTEAQPKKATSTPVTESEDSSEVKPENSTATTNTE